MRISVFPRLRNQSFNDFLLVEIQQNKNDYLHRIRYGKFDYQFMNTDEIRKEYCRNYITLKN